MAGNDEGIVENEQKYGQGNAGRGQSLISTTSVGRLRAMAPDTTEQSDPTHLAASVNHTEWHGLNGYHHSSCRKPRSFGEKKGLTGRRTHRHIRRIWHYPKALEEGARICASTSEKKSKGAKDPCEANSPMPGTHAHRMPRVKTEHDGAVRKAARSTKCANARQESFCYHHGSARSVLALSDRPSKPKVRVIFSVAAFENERSNKG